MGALDALKKWDLYKKIPEDLTVSTVPGVSLSLLGVLLMMILFLLEFNAYLTIQYQTSIVMDEALDDRMKINFNVTIPDLRCDFATIDVSDITGTRRHNMTQDIYKIRIDSKSRMIGMADNEVPQPRYAIDEHLGDLPESDAVVVPLTSDNFESFLKEHQLVAVDFFAPWCVWCKRLEPTWLRTAKTLPSLHFGQRVRVASVDCEANPALCMRQYIRAYPSIMFYKNGDIAPVEMYHGDRMVEAFTNKFTSLMEGEIDFAETRKKELHAGDQKRSGNGEIQGAPGPEGCQIYGSLDVKRVPGNFHIHLYNPAYSSAPHLVNATHLLGELWFGKPLTYKQLKRLPKEAHAELYAHRLEGQKFVAYHENHTYVHYIKVVTNTFVQSSSKEEDISVYKYTAHSNEYLEHHDMPSIMFRYDLSPMSVRITPQNVPFYHFITNACAIIGGVFTIIGVLDQIIHHTIRALNKKVL